MTSRNPSRREMQRAAQRLVEKNFEIDADGIASASSEEVELINLWQALGDLPPPELSSDLQQASVDLAHEEKVDTEPTWRIPAWERWAASIVFCMLMLGGLLAFQPWASAPQARAETFVADRAEVRDIRLADGSVLKLSPQTAVDVSLEDGARHLRLVRGEALFTVAHDASRPFIVRVGDSQVEAIGTVFNIRTIQSETEVTVVEGRIAVTIAGDAQAGSARRLLAAGERIRFGRATGSEMAVASSTQEAARPANIETATDWTRNELSFDGERLSDVVTEMNRYGRDDIILLEPTLADIPVYGVLHGGDVEGLMAVIAEIAAEHGVVNRPVARVDRASQ